MTLGLGAVCHVRWSRLHPKNQLATAYTNQPDEVSNLVVIGRENRVCRGKSKFCIVFEHPATDLCPPFEVWCVPASCKIDTEGPAEDFFDGGGNAQGREDDPETAMPAAVLNAMATRSRSDGTGQREFLATQSISTSRNLRLALQILSSVKLRRKT